MRDKIIIGVIVVLLVIAHLFAGSRNVENDEMYDETEKVNEHISIGTVEHSVGNVENNQASNTPNGQVENGNINENDNDELEPEHNLSEIVSSFVHFYFNWNYSEEEKSLYDYVTDNFFLYVQDEFGDEDAHPDDDDDHVQGVDIMIEKMKIYEPINGRSNRFDVIVEFEVIYDVPHHEIFMREIVLRLEVVRDENGYLVNKLTRLNMDGQ